MRVTIPKASHRDKSYGGECDDFWKMKRGVSVRDDRRTTRYHLDATGLIPPSLDVDVVRRRRGVVTRVALVYDMKYGVYRYKSYDVPRHLVYLERTMVRLTRHASFIATGVSVRLCISYAYVLIFFHPYDSCGVTIPKSCNDIKRNVNAVTIV